MSLIVHGIIFVADSASHSDIAGLLSIRFATQSGVPLYEEDRIVSRTMKVTLKLKNDFVANLCQIETKRVRMKGKLSASRRNGVTAQRHSDEA